MFKKLKFALYLSSAVIITLGLSISLQSLLAAWTAPTSVAPAGNVYPPINEGFATSTKLGSLAINGGLSVGGGLSVTGNSIFNNNLTVTGNLTSQGQAVCLANGTNCLVASTNADTVDSLHASSFRQFNTWQNSHYSGTDGAEYATILYDANNSAYYVDPNNTSRLNAVTPNIIPLTTGDSPNGGYNHYAIYEQPGAWAHPYPDLMIEYHTGISYVAYNGYGGHRFYTGYNPDASPTALSFSVGEFDGNVRSYGNFYAPIMYDINNAGYYVDPASTSNFNALVGNEIYANSWFRNNGARVGLYSQTYGTHLYWDSASYLDLSTNNGMRFRSTSAFDSALAGYVYHDANGFGLLSSDGNWRVRTRPGHQELYGITYFPGLGIWNSSGNVGIGTTNPSSKLSVGGNGNSSYGIYSTGSTYGIYSAGSTYGIYGTGTNGWGVVGIGGSGVYGSATNASGWSGYFNGGSGVYVSGNAQITGTIRGATYGFGGIFQKGWNDSTCDIANDFTEACNCPSGFTAKKFGRSNPCDSCSFDEGHMYYCYK